MPGRSLTLTGLFLVGACGVASAPRTTPSPPPVLRRIVIAPDIDDAVSVCVLPTAAMLFDHPLDVGPLCGLTVGQLRILIQRYNAQAD
jgi:hypothetical protein